MTPYQHLVSDTILELYLVEFQHAKPGHCMKLSGVSDEILQHLQKVIRVALPNFDCFILDGHRSDNIYITATKLIELRNLEIKPLLVFIPTNLRTAAEDSFGNATFRELSIGQVEYKITEKLLGFVPPPYEKSIEVITSFVWPNVTEVELNHYLLQLLEVEFEPQNMGNALPLLGLLPDQRLLEEPEKLKARLTFNKECVDKLTAFNKTIFDRVNSLPIAKNTLQVQIADFLKQNQSVYAAYALCQKLHHIAPHLNFGNWPIPELDNLRELKVEFLDLTGVKECLKTDPEGDLYVQAIAGDTFKLKTKFTTIPSPATAPNLAAYNLTLMRALGGGVYEEVYPLRQLKNSTAQQKYRTAEIEIDPNPIGEGTYFVRIQALDDRGNQLNIDDDFKDGTMQEEWLKYKQRCQEENKQPDKNQFSGKLTCDSDTFQIYFEEGEEGDEGGNKERKDKINNVLQAHFKIHDAYLRKRVELTDNDQRHDADWKWLTDVQSSLTSVFHAKFKDTKYNYQVELSTKLRRIEQYILENPTQLRQLDVELRSEGLFNDNDLNWGNKSLQTPDLNTLNHFLDCRKQLFHAILDDVPTRNGLVETFELNRHVAIVQEYLTSYFDLLNEIEQQLIGFESKTAEEQKKWQAIALAVQWLDTSKVKCQLPDQTHFTAYLIPSLHPLRLAWSLGLWELFTDWETQTRSYWQYLPYWNNDLLQLFLGNLTLSNHPLVMADEQFATYYEYVGELCFGWGVYLKSVMIEQDFDSMSSKNRLLLQYLQQLFNVKSIETENDVDAERLFAHVQQYLKRHPYLEQLSLNLFNAGEAQVFAKTLVALDKKLQAEKRQLRYEVRLFTNTDTIVQNGEALLRLLNPESILSEEAEAFSTPSKNRLLPKLRLSINPVEAFLSQSKTFGAHISFLINPFPLRTILHTPSNPQETSFFLQSLLVEPITDYIGDVSNRSFSWKRFVKTKPGNSTGLAKEMQQAHQHLNRLIALQMSGKHTDALPATELVLLDSDAILLENIHEFSDWVVTFDRHLGPEVFDLPSTIDQKPFLLDYIPGERLLGTSTFLTTKTQEELQFNISKALYGVWGELSTRQIFQMLENLRTMSGSILLNLENNNPNRLLEISGLALIKHILAQANLLDRHFLIPIDLHQHLFKNASVNGLSESRADLLLICIDPERRTIMADVIEVKTRGESLSRSQRNELHDSITEQLDNTIKTLRLHFDPFINGDTDRFDREIKNKELSNLLGFYVNRSLRYNLLTKADARAYTHFLADLQNGYHWEFDRKGVILELGGSFEIQTQEVAENLTFIHIGEQRVRTILEEMDKDPEIQDYDIPSTTESWVEYFTKRPVRYQLPMLPESPQALIDNVAPQNVIQEIKETDTNSIDAMIGSSDSHVTEIVPANEVENTDSQETVLSVEYDILLGNDHLLQKQIGILGMTVSTRKKIALDLSGTQTISLFGKQGTGKSYSIGVITEMALKSVENLNHLTKPLAGVIFHYSESQDYKPEFTSMQHANTKPSEVEKLRQQYGANVAGLDEIVLLVPEAKLEERRSEYPNVEVLPISFSSDELNIKDWKFLMGAQGSQALYVKQINNLMKGIRGQITIANLENTITNTALLNDGQKELAFSRLSLAREYIKDGEKLGRLLKPGRLVIVDLRDEFIDQDDALGLFVIMLNIFAEVKKYEGEDFNKFIVFDEAHKYMNNRNLTGSITTAIREMRHKGVSLLIASQDPISLPNEIIELSTVLMLHRFDSPQWLKHIQRAITQTENLNPRDLSNLEAGEAYLWVSKATSKSVTQQPVKINTRPRFTQHGGGTLTVT